MSNRRLRLAEAVSPGGGIQTGPFGSQLHAHEYTRDGVGVIMPADMISMRVNHQTVARVSDETAHRLSRHRVAEGDVLFSRRGDIGRFVVISAEEAGWLCGTGCLRVRLQKSILPQYAAMIFESHETQKWLQRNAVGQTMMNLSASILEDLPIVVRGMSEQAKWAACGEKLVEIRQLLDALTISKRAFKRGLTQQLLTGQRRFPEFRDRPWELHRFDHLCEEVSDRNGGRFGSESVMGVIKGVGFEPMRERVRGKGNLSRYKVVPPEAFAYNPMRLNIGSIAFNDLGRPIVVSPDYEVFKVRSGEADPWFVNQLRYSAYWTSFMKRAGAGSVRVRIYFSDLARLRVPKPIVEEQERIATALRLADSELDLIAAERDKIEMYKRSLLSRLLSGSLRVPV